MVRPKTKITRRSIQIVLGLLWMLDGALQLQHQMFTAAFANNVLAPAAGGQPLVVSSPMHAIIRLILTHPALFDALFAFVQLLLGVGILWQRTTRAALYASAVWALLVWYLGEGLGGLLSGQTSLLMGAPGAALLYGILALAVLPPLIGKKEQPPATWLVLVWTVLWLGGAVFQLLPGQNSITALGSMIAGNANGAPGWLATLDTRLAHMLYRLGIPAHQLAIMHMTASQMAGMSISPGSGFSSGFWLIVLLAVMQAAIGLAILWPGVIRKLAIGSGITLAFIFWLVGQSLGSFYTGLATDPNTAPLITLLGLGVLATTVSGFDQLQLACSRLFDRLERLLT